MSFDSTYAQRIHAKRMKRADIKEGRLRCHGSVFNCRRVHRPMKKPTEFVLPTPRTARAESMWARFIKWVSRMFIWKTA